jgi:dTDP-glucose pyrophosphorylase
MSERKLETGRKEGTSATIDSWRRALLHLGATVQDAISNLDETAMQITLVVSPDGVLIGTITDGDVRRGLLRGLGLGSPIDTMIQLEPLVVPHEVDRATAVQIMRANRIHQLPVVDEERRVVGLHLWDDLMVPVERSNLVVIMAGGKGTRLRPHTETCPKPLLPVRGKPMLEHIIERAKAEGFCRFVLAIHYLGEMVEHHFGDGSRWQVQIDYLREEQPLGTAGALSLIDPRPETPFLVSNGDVLTGIRYGDLLDYHGRHEASATMAVREHVWQHPFGVVHTNGVEILGFDEKPITRSHINAGVYVLEPLALDLLAREKSCDMPVLFNRLQEGGSRTVVYPIHEPWLDVGGMDDYHQANGPQERES